MQHKAVSSIIDRERGCATDPIPAGIFDFLENSMPSGAGILKKNFWGVSDSSLTLLEGQRRIFNVLQLMLADMMDIKPSLTDSTQIVAG